MYSPEAVARRRCTGTKTNGEPCRAWAVWDDDRQLCTVHAARHSTGPISTGYYPRRRPHVPTRVVPCRCDAYPHPHRPAGGRCQWPNDPGVSDVIRYAELPSQLASSTGSSGR